ncbi:hypothetical protein CC80DRAFT_502958 [Byssothecium circinans]|uniref:Uncharacterized protein n=1 Tax=Byssothecium circinans TaxID=147558 RepID=A0A6A5TZ54_9PLEO|nr:hypothetical protein CC80DRAFT_502958 [Byssothecium circinans]
MYESITFVTTFLKNRVYHRHIELTHGVKASSGDSLFSTYVNATTDTEAETLITSDKPVALIPLQPLGEQFVSGWGGIPDEVKIITMSGDFFHKKNVFVLTSVWRSIGESNDYREFFAYPNAMVNKFIRVVHVTVPLGVIHLERLHRLSTGQYGFPNLQYAQIKIHEPLSGNGEHFSNHLWPAAFHAWRVELPDISFSCKGRIYFIIAESVTHRLSERHYDYMNLVGQLNAKITFDGQSPTAVCVNPD